MRTRRSIFLEIVSKRFNFICVEQLANMFENLSSSEWLLYISEWQHQNQSISNIRVTTKVAVHSLLSNSDDLQIRGAAIIHNLACKEVKTVVCILLVRLTFSHISLAVSRFHFHNPSPPSRIEGTSSSTIKKHFV